MGGSRRAALAWGLTAVALGALAGAAPAADVEHVLVGGKTAKFSIRPTVVRGVVRFTGDVPMAAMPDPRCPATASVRLVTGGDAVQELPLPCAGWAQTSDGFRYKATAGGPSDVIGVALSPRKMEFRLRLGPGGVPPPLERLEVGLRIDDHVACGRFTRFVRNDATRVLSHGPTDRCRAPRPNLLVLVLDDARADGLDRMPVFQARIVGEGRSFENAFTPHASCCPSRASLLTGQYALRHHTYQVSGPIGGADTFRVNGTDQRTIAVTLRGAGYRTGLFGKYLNAYGLERGLGPLNTFYVPPGWDRWWAFAAERYGGVHGATYEIVDEAGQTTVYSDHTTDAEYSTDLSALHLRTFIAEAHAAGRPFYAVWTPLAPHGDVPGLLPAPAARHRDTITDLPPWRPPSWREADVSDKPGWVRSLTRLLDTEIPNLFPALADLFRLRQYESLLAVDEQLEAILDQLETLGIADDTAVVVTSDNGIGWGEHHLWMQKACPYDECQRVPLAIRYPRRLTPVASSLAMPVANIDIAPTLADLAGVTMAQTPDGLSLVPWLADAAPPPGRSEYMLEHWRAQRGSNVRYDDQVIDGDRLRVLFGPTRVGPRLYVEFEFDVGDGVAGDAVPVWVGADAGASFTALADAVRAHVPGVTSVHDPAAKVVRLNPTTLSANHSIAVLIDVDAQGVLRLDNEAPDYLGLRDVVGGYTWVEYETGERELYDLNVDPHQLDNRAGDPAYAAVRQGMSLRLQAMVAQILAAP